MKDYDQYLKNFGQLLHDIKISYFAKKKVFTVNVKEDFHIVEKVFVENHIRHLPVVDNDNKLVGIISQRDVYKRVAPRRFVDGRVVFTQGQIVDENGYYDKEELNKYILNHIMRKDPIFLKQTHSIGEAIHLIVSNKIGCVPIVDDNMHVIGIVTRFDILKLASDVYRTT